MGNRKLRVGTSYTLVAALTAMALGSLVAACGERGRDLPVCPGDPRCETKKR